MSKRTINKLQIKFDGNTFIPCFQNGIRTLQTNFNNGDKVKVNSASSGIGVTKDGIKECWVYLN